MKKIIVVFLLSLICGVSIAQKRFYNSVDELINEPNPLGVTIIVIEPNREDRVFFVLPKEINRFQNLEGLEITCSKFRGLSIELNKLTKLKFLAVNSAIKMEEFPKGFNPPNLKEIILRDCIGFKNFDELRNIQSLESFTFKPNYVYVEGSAFTEVPKSIFELKNLTYLDLYGCENLKISSNLCNLSKLEYFYPPRGYIQLPECIGKMSALKALYLGTEFSKSEIQELKKKYPHLKIYHQYGDKN